jgi:hypothetical protein
MMVEISFRGVMAWKSAFAASTLQDRAPDIVSVYGCPINFAGFARKACVASDAWIMYKSI